MPEDHRSDAEKEKEAERRLKKRVGRIMFLFSVAVALLIRLGNYNVLRDRLDNGDKASMGLFSYYKSILDMAEKKHFRDITEEALIKCAQLKEPYDIDEAISYYRRSRSRMAKERIEFLEPYTEYTGEYVSMYGNERTFLYIGFSGNEFQYTFSFLPLSDYLYENRYVAWGVPYRNYSGEWKEEYVLDQETLTLVCHETYTEGANGTVYDVDVTKRFISTKSQQYRYSEYMNFSPEYFYTKTKELNDSKTAAAEKRIAEREKKEEEEKKKAEEKSNRERRERDRIVKELFRMAAEEDLGEALEMEDNPEDYKSEFGDDWEEYYDYYTEILDDYEDWEDDYE